jgi:hypothetical protein
LAGCFGLLPLAGGDEAILSQLERAIDRAGVGSQFAALFPMTQPRWQGVWIESPLGPSRVEILWQALGALPAAASSLDAGWRDLRLALAACRQHGLSLSGQLYPAGEVRGNWWQVVPHCGCCQAAWQAGWRNCAVCGGAGPANPGKKRRARGGRPYLPLTRLLGDKAGEFLARYRAGDNQGVKSGTG